jgi:hypothetical protein
VAVATHIPEVVQHPLTNVAPAGVVSVIVVPTGIVPHVTISVVLLNVEATQPAGVTTRKGITLAAYVTSKSSTTNAEPPQHVKTYVGSSGMEVMAP